MRDAGERDTLITFQRDMGEGKDELGGQIEDWQTHCEEWASVRFGSASERREAAQKSAAQTATFRVLLNDLTLALTPLDRIGGYLSADWDIIGTAPVTAAEIEITAVRKAA